VTVNLLLILLLKAKDYLSWYDTLVWVLEVQLRIKGERGGIFKQVCRDFFTVDTPLHVVSRLIYTQKGKTVKHTRMDLLSSVGYNTDNDL
jgi:hypothetical protein